MHRTLPLSLLVWALALPVPALAGDEGPAAPPDDGLSGAGKVIEVAPDGEAKVVKGAPAEQPAEQAGPARAEDAVSNAESCRKRLAAQCRTLQRCLGAAGGSEGMPLPCEGMAPLCENLEGDAPYTRRQLEACAKGLGALRCQNDLDPADPKSFQLEARVPACKPILAAEKAQGPGGGQGLQGLGKIDAKGAEELQRQLNQALVGE
jgi:hypothetical protein